MIEPTIGRVVWFYPPKDANPHGQPHAALIAFVQNARLVNLAVFNENGNAYSATSIPLLQDDDMAPETAHAVWMPYQKGQAAKAEQLQAANVDLRLQIPGAANPATAAAPAPTAVSAPPPAAAPAPAPTAPAAPAPAAG